MKGIHFIVAILAIALVSSEKLRFLETAQEKPSTKVSGMQKFNDIFECFNKVADSWGKIVNTFKSSSKSEVVQEIIGKGFTHFNGQIVTTVTKGLKEAYWEKYITDFPKRIKADPDIAEQISFQLMDIEYSDSHGWNSLDLIFGDTSKTDSVRYASIVGTHNEELGNYDIIYCSTKGGFKLAPDVTVMKKSVSILGGLWESEEIKYINKPKNLNEEELSLIMSFFQMIAMKEMAKLFGFIIPTPQGL